MATERMEIRVSPEQAEGLAEFIDHRWYQDQEELTGFIGEDTRHRLSTMMALLDLYDALGNVKESEEVVSAPRQVLRHLLEEGGDYARETISHALRGDYGEDAQRKIRSGQGLMELARREGLYEGVMV